MKNNKNEPKILVDMFKKNKVFELNDLKKIIGTESRMTVFRKLKSLNYITSCSHSGKFYSLTHVANFNENGLWFFKSILFSKMGTLLNTLKNLIVNSHDGYSSTELEQIIKIKVSDGLLQLLEKGEIEREKIRGKNIYFSKNDKIRKKQNLYRLETIHNLDNIKLKPEILMNELKAAIVLFYSLLDEKQQRLYAGLESLKVGRGGDNDIAKLLNLERKTVLKGRKELLTENVQVNTIRRKGGGRKAIQKKNS